MEAQAQIAEERRVDALHRYARPPQQQQQQQQQQQVSGLLGSFKQAAVARRDVEMHAETRERASSSGGTRSLPPGAVTLPAHRFPAGMAPLFHSTPPPLTSPPPQQQLGPSGTWVPVAPQQSQALVDQPSLSRPGTAGRHSAGQGGGWAITQLPNTGPVYVPTAEQAEVMRQSLRQSLPGSLRRTTSGPLTAMLEQEQQQQQQQQGRPRSKSKQFVSMSGRQIAFA